MGGVSKDLSWVKFITPGTQKRDAESSEKKLPRKSPSLADELHSRVFEMGPASTGDEWSARKDLHDLKNKSKNSSLMSTRILNGVR